MFINSLRSYNCPVSAQEIIIIIPILGTGKLRHGGIMLPKVTRLEKLQICGIVFLCGDKIISMRVLLASLTKIYPLLESGC